MKTKIAIGLLLIFCSLEIRPILPFIDYCLNYQYISQVLCVNKDKPELHCNGKCYLNKELKKVQETEKNNKKIPRVEWEKIPTILQSELKFNFNNLNYFFKKLFFFYNFFSEGLTVSPPTPPPKI
ncbi:hypothetical protein [Tenacibaculum sp. UWU-22]|uniref:hypothetical protein n=1 Tax=Tenacibaculum sp. UWU-22 TaxID=3234187 RepID=UPI0034DB032D